MKKLAKIFKDIYFIFYFNASESMAPYFKILVVFLPQPTTVLRSGVSSASMTFKDLVERRVCRSCNVNGM